jgi:hypothetical protein
MASNNEISQSEKRNLGSTLHGLAQQQRLRRAKPTARSTNEEPGSYHEEARYQLPSKAPGMGTSVTTKKPTGMKVAQTATPSPLRLQFAQSDQPATFARPRGEDHSSAPRLTGTLGKRVKMISADHERGGHRQATKVVIHQQIKPC